MLNCFSLRFYLVLVSILFINSCAIRVTPSGGDKDEKPPVIKNISPANYSTNLKEKKIVIDFNEFIQLKELNKQLVISPLMEPEPRIRIHKKSLNIQLPDSLKANTTYTLNFGDAIADNKEGNSITDFQYVFSTGDVLDSLFCSGNVVDAYSHKIEKGITVMLYHDKEDSLPFKKLPDYFAKTDEQGNYTIKNISPGTYKLIALNDKNNNYRCDNPQEEATAFADSAIDISNHDVKMLQLFTQPPAKLFVKKAIKESNGGVIISFSKPVENLSWKMISQNSMADNLTLISSAKDSLYMWIKDSTIDTLKLELSNNQIPFDTVLVALRKSQIANRGEKRKTIFPYSSNTIGGMLMPTDTLMLVMHNPLTTALTNQIKIYQDSVLMSDYKIFYRDSLHRYLVVQAKWKENMQYKLFAPPGTFKDVSNNSSDSITLNFKLIPVADLGSLKIIVAGLTSGQQYSLQLINESLQMMKQINLSGSGNYLFENITPGNYKARLLKDTNNNKQWDNGDYWKKIQPEQFYYHTEPIQIRSNWELEINMNVKF